MIVEADFPNLNFLPQNAQKLKLSAYAFFKAMSEK
jgi:hypothetical protein